MASLSVLLGGPGSPIMPRSLGISARYPKDVGIGADPAVLFVEDFEDSIAGVQGRWTSDAANDSSLSTDVPSGSVVGSHSIAMPRTAGNNGANFLRRFGVELDQVYVRFYVKFTSVSHHSGVWIGAERVDGGGGPFFPDPHAGLLPCRVQDGSCALQGRGAWFWNSAEMSPYGQFDSYTACLNMTPDGTGTYWGNLLIGNPALVIPTNTWACVEHMIKVNTAGTTNGELKIWLNGTQVANLVPGSPVGTWANGVFTPGAGTPFPGFEWRDSNDFGVNYIWMQNYNDSGVDNTMWYDHVVAATSYIGPLVP